VDNAQTLFLIDNVTNGFSLHQLDDAVCIRSYNTNPIKMFPKQVVFGEKLTWWLVAATQASYTFSMKMKEPSSTC
jgi:hypothetical protein